MHLRLASTFTDSLARLTGDEQKAVKTTAFDLQLKPANPGLQFHKLDKSRDKQFWSVRVNADIRLIVHRTPGSLLLCYVDHHDKAYAWAERRKLETHPTTGAAQLVEIRETVREVTVPKYVDGPTSTPVPAPKPLLFRETATATLLGFGVPEEWLDDVRAATEDTLFDLAEHLPAEAVEALLELATGGQPKAQPVAASADPFEHPDAQRRFRLVADSAELERALNWPWERWSVFLHPAQREVVEREYSGPARVAGTAGTGKTVVALHRAAHLARTNVGARVLVTTFSVTLARMLAQKLRRLVGDDAELAGRITVKALDEVGLDLYERSMGKPTVPTPGMLRSLLAALSKEVGGHSFSDRFLLQEWTEVVDPWRLTTWEAYRDVARLGRKTRLGEKQRAALWQIFERAHALLEERGLYTMPMVFAAVTEELAGGAESPYDFTVVDEAQDVNVPQLRFLAALAGGRLQGLFFAGDLGQRIFQTPFSWKSLGVDVRGRSHTLRLNYRTSHQIRRQADQLLGREIADVDGVVEERRGAISVFDGPEPEVRVLETSAAEGEAVGAWIAARVAEGVPPEGIAVFVRSEEEIPRGRAAVAASGLAATSPAPGVDPEPGKVSVLPMHQAKGLEFRAVAVMACDDDIVPLQARIEAVADEADLEEVYNTERHLLYVACTRARDHLLVSGVRPGSEFLVDLEVGAIPGSG